MTKARRVSEPCACGQNREPRKHSCSECRLLRRKEAIKREHVAKAESRKSNHNMKGRAVGESGYPGVYRSAHGPTWTGEVRHAGSRHNIGNWPTALEAHNARIELYFDIIGHYPINELKPVKYAQDVAKGEADTPLERSARLIQHLISIAY